MMDFNQITVMKMANAHMRYQAQRQNVLSQNIANIDTPGYQSKDLTPLDFGKFAQAEARRLEMRTTSSVHQAGFRQFEGPYREEKLRTPYEVTPVKNSVSLEQQMGNINNVSLNFQLSTTIYRKMDQMFKTALGTR
jgi:flagellar basal-body rod protein FlgB